MRYEHIVVPTTGTKIRTNTDGSITVPDEPVIPFIEGDGIGIDVTPAMIKVVEAAVARAYAGKRKIHWMEIFAGAKANRMYGSWLPEETLHALRDFVVSIKGPLETPVGDGIRSLNVAVRQTLDLYACVRPIRYFPGVVSPMADASLTDMVIFRENTEDIYAGIEWAAGTPRCTSSSITCNTSCTCAKSASRPVPASASSRYRRRAVSAWCVRPSSTRSTTIGSR